MWAPPSGIPSGHIGLVSRARRPLVPDRTAPPAAGYWLATDGRWYPAGERRTRPGEASRWGLGDVWWGVLAYVVAGIAGVAVLSAADALLTGGVDDEGPFAISSFVGPQCAGDDRRRLARRLVARVSGALRRRLRAHDSAVGPADRARARARSAGRRRASRATGSTPPSGRTSPRATCPWTNSPHFGDFAVFFVAVAVVTPLVEELFFRGLLYRSLLKRGRSAPRAILATTICLRHPASPCRRHVARGRQPVRLDRRARAWRSTSPATGPAIASPRPSSPTWSSTASPPSPSTCPDRGGLRCPAGTNDRRTHHATVGRQPGRPGAAPPKENAGSRSLDAPEATHGAALERTRRCSRSDSEPDGPRARRGEPALPRANEPPETTPTGCGLQQPSTRRRPPHRAALERTRHCSWSDSRSDGPSARRATTSGRTHHPGARAATTLDAPEATPQGGLRQIMSRC